MEFRFFVRPLVLAAVVFAVPSAYGQTTTSAVTNIATLSDGDTVVHDVFRNALISRAATTGVCSVVTGGDVGAGPLLVGPGPFAEEAPGTLIVVDVGASALVRVDVATGDRSVVSDAVTGTGPVFADLVDVAVEGSGAFVVVDAATIVRVDPSSGDRTLVSGGGAGSGTAFADPAGIAVESGGALLVSDRGLAALLRVDATTGARTVVSSDSVGGGDPLLSPTAIAVEAGGDVIVVDFDARALLRIDPGSGDRAVLSAHAGEDRFRPRDVAILPSGDLVAANSTVPPHDTTLVDAGSGSRSDLQCLCPPLPDPSCIDAAQAKLVVSEKSPGKEKVKLQWKRIADAVTLADYGDPVSGGTATLLCIYDDADDLLDAYIHPGNVVGQPCDSRPCWSTKAGKSHSLLDRGTEYDGLGKVRFGAGAAGRGKADAQAMNVGAKGLSNLRTGLAAALSSSVAATIELRTGSGLCVGATLNSVSKADGVRYIAKKK